MDCADSALLPMALVACTVNVYAMPLVSPVTVSGLAVPLAVIPVDTPLIYAVAVKPVIGDPPVLLAVNVTFACTLLGTAVPIVGAAGTVGTAGVAAALMLL